MLKTCELLLSNEVITDGNEDLLDGASEVINNVITNFMETMDVDISSMNTMSTAIDVI